MTDSFTVLLILGISIILFITDRVRVDVVALLVLLALIFTGLVSPAAAFAGFASPAVITVWAVFIISGALFRSGVADRLARIMMRLSGRSPRRLLLVVMLVAGLMSAFMNNIGAVAILLPPVVTMSRQLKIAPSKLLMPLAFAALLGGNLTLVGTPPNILAASLLEANAQVESFSFFDFTPMGLVVFAAGVAYMLLVGYRLLPERTPGGDLAEEYPVREYVTELLVSEASPLVGKTLPETGFGEKYDLVILRVRRTGDTTFGPDSDRPLQVGDLLLVEGAVQDILSVSQETRLKMANNLPEEAAAARVNELNLAEITLSPRSVMAGATLKQIGFRAQFGVSVLAMRHNGRSLITHLGDVPLRFGDSLLVQGDPEKLALLRRDTNFLMLDMPPVETRRNHKAPITLTILVGLLVIITLGWLDTSTTMLLGALLMVLTGVLSMDEAYEAIDWKSVFLIAGMLPLGSAMETTGTARLLADQIVGLVGTWGAVAVLGGIFLLTALLTEVISNAAAAVLMVPIAIDAAFGLGAAPQPFVMATVIAASTSFLMPVGHQVNVIIYGPGGYRFTDYARVGLLLNLILLLLAVTVLPLIWPLYPG